jgi:hypothetical protein
VTTPPCAACAPVEPQTGESAGHVLGRSRGGPTSKLHLANERGQKMLALVTTAGQPAVRAGPLTHPRAEDGPGRPRTTPKRVLADQACRSKANRTLLARRGIKAVIPVKDDQRSNRR